MNHENPKEAFQNAITAGRLSLDEDSELYAGKWMYMFTDDRGITQFKNNNTRKYLHEK